MLDLSIVIVNFHTEKYLAACLSSLFVDNAKVNFEVILVDNGSDPQALSSLKKKFPQIKLLSPRTNPGFGKANNLGAKSARGKYLLFLNPDTLVPPDTISTVLTAVKDLPHLGAYSCQLRFADSSIQPTGGYFPTLPRLFSWQIFSDFPPFSYFIRPVHLRASAFTKAFSPDWLQGAFLLIPRLAFSKIGGFDEQIFMYAEDIDICLRLKQAGLNIYYQPAPFITHLQSKASSSSFALLSEIDGIKYLVKKYLPTWQYPLANLIIKTGSLLRFLIFGIILADDQKRHVYFTALSR